MKAEASNPKGDVWFGGTGDPHLQAAEEGPERMYQSPNMKDLHNWAQYQAQISGYKTVGAFTPARWASATTPKCSARKTSATGVLGGHHQARVQG